MTSGTQNIYRGWLEPYQWSRNWLERWMRSATLQHSAKARPDHTSTARTERM